MKNSRPRHALWRKGASLISRPTHLGILRRMERAMHRAFAMNAIELLKMQNVRTRQLFNAVRLATTAQEKALCFEALAEQLAAQSEARERAFFPAAVGPRTHALLARARAVQSVTRDRVEELRALPRDDERFDLNIAMLRDELERNELEERALFEVVEARFNADFLSTLGCEVAAIFDAHGGQRSA